MVKVPLTVAPAASLTVSCTLLNVPVAVGVPVKVTFVPVMVAVNPVGRLDWALTVNGPVPLLIGTAPV